MRKWRPGYRSIYVIPKINGSYESLKIILDRILPLRFSIGQEDMLFFLGDYIDVGPNSDKVIDFLLTLLPEQNIFFIKGDREELLLKSLDSDANYYHWLNSGGHATIASYLERNSLSRNEALTLPRSRLQDLIPENHLNFFRSLDYKIIYDDYVFIHSGFNYLLPFEESSKETILFDDSVIKFIKNNFKNKKDFEIKSDKIVVASHNNENTPVIHQQYFMLDAGAPERLIVFDINNMICGMVKNGKSRIYDHKYKILIN